ncbi:response regulator transcription factor [Candidatus Enterococcus huntleyi]|uniref:response regulator transcription factor n=1 Tax=Candidatus Enterococcus huntleyi TaxID=1857217 RepID=UPI00192A17F9|nr:response regulator transcription factor [Enterococcus sp. JM4C]
MNIFILEDDLLQQQKLERLIKKISLAEKINYKNLFATAKPTHLLDKIQLTSQYNLYFLDLEIKGETKKGLEVAQKIRETDPYGAIVFMTTHSEMATLTFSYKVSALDFIEKDQEAWVIEKRVKECLELAKNRTQTSVSTDAFTFESKYTKFQLPFSEILYFETTGSSHKIRLVTTAKIVEFYADLKEIVQMDERLFRCHRAFVINLANVKSIDKTNKQGSFPMKSSV